MHIPVLNVLILLGQTLVANLEHQDAHLVATQGAVQEHQDVNPGATQDAVQAHQGVNPVHQDVSQVAILEQKTPEPTLKSQANISISSK